VIHRYLSLLSAAALAAACAFTPATPVLAQVDLDTPGIAYGVTGMGKQVLTITAGATGCPNGFTVWWAKHSDYAANGYQWWLNGDERYQGEAHFWGVPTLNTDGGRFTTFVLAPFQSIDVEIGDLADESGVDVTGWRSSWGGELEPGTPYLFCAFANATATLQQSGFTENVATSTVLQQDCTFTQGYWKNHPESWPAGCLPMQLGSNLYTQAELLLILNQPVAGNGAVSLAHQLIATKLNVCMGANPIAAAACITQADALLSTCGADRVPPHGACSLPPAITSATTQCLDDYNNGLIGPGHCPPTKSHDSTWGKIKTQYR